MAKLPPRKYIVPYGNEADIDDPFVCISFFCPAEWWGVGALLGSFASLGKRGLWEDTEGGRIMADRFLEAWALSFEDDFMTKVTNEITVNCGGCGSCSGGGGSTSYLDGIQSGAESIPATGATVEGDFTTVRPDASTDPLPVGYEGDSVNWAEYNQEKCRKANFIVDRLIKTMHNMVGAANSGLEYSLAGLATAVALAIAEPLFFGEVALIAILLAPALVRLLGRVGIDTQGITDAINDIDKCSLVVALYEAESAGEIPGIFESNINDLLIGLGANERVADFLAWYSTLAINQTTIDWFYLGVGKFMPDDYVGSCACTQEVSSNWTPPWNFTADTEGWVVGPQNTANSAWEVHDPPLITGFGGGALFVRVSDASVQEVGHWTISAEAGQGTPVAGATNLKYRVTFGAMNSNGRSIQAIATLDDGTVVTGPVSNIQGGGGSLHLLDVDQGFSNEGKTVVKIDFIAKTTIDANSSPNGYILIDGVELD